MKRERMGLSVVLIIVLGMTLPARAQDTNMRAELARVAGEVKALLGGNKTVALRDFNDLSPRRANAGPGLQDLFQAELSKLGLTIDPEADRVVTGEYTFKDDPATGLLVVSLLIRVLERNGEVLVDLVAKAKAKRDDFTAKSSDTKDITKVTGFTGHLPPDGSKKERNDEIKKRLKEPSVFIHGPNQTLISSTKDSPFAVELLVKPCNAPREQPARPRPAHEDKGQAFVDIRKDELYEVKIYNNSEHEVAVALTIDGLDEFTFSDDRKPDGTPRFSHFIIGKKSTATIVGWHKTANPMRKDNFLSFLVTEYGQGAASKHPTKSQGKVGVLTVSFAYSFPEGTARSGGETGFGPPVEVKQQPVKRVIDPPFDFISVRYTR